MSWDQTYTHALAIGADMLGSEVAFSNDGADITISSMCGLELRKRTLGQPYSQSLVDLGEALNKIQLDHCELAITADLVRCQTAIVKLQSVPKL